MIRINSTKWSSQQGNLDGYLQRKLAEMRPRIEEATKEAARGAAVELAVATFPTGSTPDPAALAAVARDIRKVFTTAGEVFGRLKERYGARVAGAFYRAVKSGKLADARTILRQSGGDFALLDFGRVSSSLHEAARSGPRKRVTLSSPILIVPESDREAYIVTVQKQLGSAASGWSACASILGGESGIPNWKSTSVHGSHFGAVRPMEGNRIGFVLCNRAPHAARNLPIGQALDVAARARKKIREALE